ncbi:MAG: putative RND efflux membrane fusion protein [Anaerolineae bacterium]|jgi:multidrug resistance efflux pump|nr:MAG: putative RND efflux membrane fusion protein [Anaerolineae bacterium]
MGLKKKHFGLLFLFGLLSGFLAACGQQESTPTPVDEISMNTAPVVSATGVVLPLKRSTLSVTFPGVVDQVLVERGDVVEEGQVLLRLKGKEEIEAQVAQARAEVISAEQALNDLYENHDLALAAALQAYYLANNAVKDAQYQLDNFTVPVNQKNLTAVEAVKIMKERLDAATAAFQPYRNESEQNERRKELKEKLDEAQADYNAAVKRLTYEFALQEALAKLAKAERDYQTLLPGPDPDLVALAEARLATAKAALAAAEKKLEDLEIKALYAGTISEVYVREGEWVAPGQPILILADLEHLRIETTDLNEIDVARVKVGDNVVITFDALPDVVVNGKVVLISPKASEGSGVNYTVVIEMDEIPEALRWGMTAFVDIQVQE